ncbi:MAG: TonB-dependent receptor plug domain-containing protein [Mangrovibacterium sp.]
MKTKNFRIPLKWVAVLAAVLAFHFSQAEVIDSLNVEEVVVTASRLDAKLKNIPQKVEVIGQDEIRSGSQESLVEVLKQYTNIDLVQYPGISATISMRGFSPSAVSRSYTLVLIDGKPAGTTNLAAINLNNVERIEIVKGPYSSIYGSDAMAGVVNIITKKNEGKLQGQASVEYGSFEKQAANVFLAGDVADGIGFTAGFSHQKRNKNYKIGEHNFLDLSESDKLLLDKNSYGDRMENSKYELNSVNAGLNGQFGEKWSASANAIYTYGNKIGVPGNYWGSYGQALKDVRRLNLYSDVEYKTSKSTFRFSPYFTQENDPNYSDNSNEAFINFESRVREYGFQFQDMITLGNLKATMGVDYKTYDYHSERYSDATTPAAPYKPDNRNLNTALFAQLAYSSGKLDLNGGIRYDHFTYELDANEDLNSVKSDEDYNTVNPSIGAQYHILDNLRFHASAGTAFFVPDAYKVAGNYEVSVYFPEWDYTWVASYAGNPDLKPEKSKTVDFGFKYNLLDQAFNADLTYFKTYHKDKIADYTLENGTTSYMNADKAQMEGLELMSSFDFGVLANRKYKLELYSNWTFMFKSELEIDDAGITLKKDMQYVSKTTGSFGVFYDSFNGLTSRINARFIGPRLEMDRFALLRPDYSSDNYYTRKDYTLADEIIQHSNYMVFDYTLGYKFKKGFSIQGSVLNALDENYTEKDGYNMPGRSFQVKVGYAF